MGVSFCAQDGDLENGNLVNAPYLSKLNRTTPPQLLDRFACGVFAK